MRIGLAAIALLSAAAPAQPSADPPRIVVSGIGSVTTPPDVVRLTFTLRGEGGTSDVAVAALVARRAAIEGGLARLGAGRFPLSTGQMALAEVRDEACDRNDYGRARLSVGPCAVIGYIARLPMTIHSRAVADAGTALGLIGRLGGVDGRIDGYDVADAALARRRATAAALADARIQAEAIASGARLTLGPILSISDGAARGQAQFEDVVVTARAAPAPPPPPPPPIAVELTPRPIETQARITVVYAIGS